MYDRDSSRTAGIRCLWIRFARMSGEPMSRSWEKQLRTHLVKFPLKGLTSGNPKLTKLKKQLAMTAKNS